MENKWDICKPVGTSETAWRRQQIANYLLQYPNSKPRHVIDWIKSQAPNPWPSCNSNALGKIMGRLRDNPGTDSPSCCRVPSSHVRPSLVKSDISNVVAGTHVQLLMIKWDKRMPEAANVYKWRCTQLGRYLHVFPTHKPKQILE